MKNFLNSFKYAFSGLNYLIKERSFRIHILALCVVISAGFYFDIELTEWLAILIISALVITLEALNSAIERLCDLYSTDQNPKIKAIKDISAGAVLVTAIFAVVIGCLIFWKYIF